MAACLVSPEAGSNGAQLRVEELEVGTREIASGDVHRFIAACAVPRSAMVRTIGHAFDIASASGSVLLRVEIAPSGATVTVSAPPAAALVPLAAPERDRAPETLPSPLPGSTPLPASSAVAGEAGVPDGAIARHPRAPLSTMPLRRASDREHSTAGSALPGPL
jgi:hypothetical protein